MLCLCCSAPVKVKICCTDTVTMFVDHRTMKTSSRSGVRSDCDPPICTGRFVCSKVSLTTTGLACVPQHFPACVSYSNQCRLNAAPLTNHEMKTFLFARHSGVRAGEATLPTESLHQRVEGAALGGGSCSTPSPPKLEPFCYFHLERLRPHDGWRLSQVSLYFLSPTLTCRRPPSV